MSKGVMNNFERIKRDIQGYTLKELAVFLIASGTDSCQRGILPERTIRSRRSK